VRGPRAQSRRPGARRGRLLLALAVALATVTVGATAVAAPVASAAGWDKPFEFSKPGTLDLLPTQLALSSGGAAAAGFTVHDVDAPGQSQAYVGMRSARGGVSAPRTIGSAQQTLALTYDGSALELVTGIGRAGRACCTSAQAVRMTAGGALQRPRTLVGGLAGATEARLLTLGNGAMLAAVATQRGVWVIQSARSNRFGIQHRLTAPKQMPQSLSDAWLGGQSTIVAWTAARGPTTPARSIYYARGTKSGAPRRVRTLLAVPSGHRIDELAVARRGSGATAAWVESWHDRHGAFHSLVRAADVAAGPVARTLSSADVPASGLDAASDTAGDQAITFKTCRQNGSCTAHAAVRGASKSFGRATSFGAQDPSETPATAVGRHGQVIVGWVRGGRPMAAVGAAASGRFGAARALSDTIFAYDLTVAFGPGRDALAAWSQGTLNPSVVGAAYRAP
jgi:hypothetical protein